MPAASTPESEAKALAKQVGDAVVFYAAARVEALQARADELEEAPALSEPQGDPPRAWQTFTNLLLGSKKEAGLRPQVTVSAAARVGLLAYYAAAVKLLSAVEAGAGAPRTLADLVAGDQSSAANAVGFMAAVARSMGPRLTVGGLGRDADFYTFFSRALERQTGRGSAAHREAAMAFLALVKAVGWFAGTAAYESEGCTLNRAAMITVLAQLEAVVDVAVCADQRAALGAVRAAMDAKDAADRTALKKKNADKAAAAKVAKARAAAKQASAAKATAAKPAAEAAADLKLDEAPSALEAPPAAEAAVVAQAAVSPNAQPASPQTKNQKPAAKQAAQTQAAKPAAQKQAAQKQAAKPAVETQAAKPAAQKLAAVQTAPDENGEDGEDEYDEDGGEYEGSDEDDAE